MNALDPITLADAGPHMAEAVGLSWEQNRPEVVKYVNKFRELIFTLYNDFKLFNESHHCLKVGTFKYGCDSACCADTFQGFTLPPDIVSIEDAWNYGRPLTVRSRWREGHTGIGLPCGPRLDVIELGEIFPTERELGAPSTLRIYTERDEDSCKRVVIKGEDACGKPLTATFSLVADGWAVVQRKKFARILSVSLPPDRVGGIKLADSEGNELSSYAPWERVPAYRRFRVATAHCSSTIHIKGVKKFTPVYFDSDIVEIGNTLVIEAAGKFFKYGDNSTDTADLRRAENDFAKLKVLMLGAMARHAGGAEQDGPPFITRNNRANKTLPGYSRR